MREIFSLIVLQSEVRKMYYDLFEDEPDFDGFKFDSRYVSSLSVLPIVRQCLL